MTVRALLVVLTSCTQTVQLVDDPLAKLVGLDVAPIETTLAITDLGRPPQTVAFTATGHFADGTTRDVTTQVQWTVDDPAPGVFATPGLYTTSNAAAGHVAITASANGVVATAQLTVDVSITIVDGAFPPPGDPLTLFAPGIPIVPGDAMRAPAILYPNDATLFPQRVARTLFQYDRGMQNDGFRMMFDSDVLHVAVYTGADRWSADGAIWSLIAASGISAPIQVEVDGVASAAATTIYASAPITLDFSRDDPGGAVTYWSAATNGVMRGALDAVTAGKLYPDAGDATCAGCHAISRDGLTMAMGLGGETLQTINLATLAPAIPVTAKLPMGWATYSPDGTRVLVANKGMLSLYDAATGAPIGSPDGHVHLPPMTFATHPDWSPDGTQVAVALTAMAPTNMDVKSASIALLAVHGDQLGMPQTIVATTGMDNAFFPRWSPDGQYLAFVHATATSHAAPSAELELVAATGGIPIALAVASHRVATSDGVPNLADTMPWWSPASGDYAWLAFASTRPYGTVMPMANHAQIWIAGIDLGQHDGDPSFAAFWLPCQDVTVLNTNAVWATLPDTEGTPKRAMSQLHRAPPHLYTRTALRPGRAALTMPSWTR